MDHGLPSVADIVRESKDSAHHEAQGWGAPTAIGMGQHGPYWPIAMTVLPYENRAGYS